MLKKIVSIIGSVGLMFGLSGCMQGDTVVKVNKDGSGTIEKTLMVRKDVVLMFQSMSAMMNQKNSGTPKEFKLFDENKLKNQASNNGEGVTYVSGKEVHRDNFEGYTAVYTFADINKLILNQDLSSEMPNGKKSNKPKEYVTFHFDKGDTSKLSINIPKTKNKEKQSKPQPATASKEQTEEMLKQTQEMFEGMRMSMSVEVDGRIVQTNAAYPDGSHITLMDIDFDKVIKDPEAIKAFTQAEDMSMYDQVDAIKNIEGVRVDMNDEIVVKFK